MNVKILKYDPAMDAQPYYKTYNVPWKKNITVLEILVYVHILLLRYMIKY